MAIWLKADGAQKVVHPADGKRFSLEEVQKYVGGYAQEMKICTIGEKRCGVILMDEDAGPKGVTAVNKDASNIAGRVILGDVLVCNNNRGKWC